MSNEKPAILFVGHGSRDDEAVSEFYQLAENFKQRFPERMVETGFLEFVRPIISDAVEKLIAQGAKKIHAVPGMLMIGAHAKNDIPSELNNLQLKHGIRIEYGAELGVDPKMLQAARDRIEQAEASIAGYSADQDRRDTLLIVVGRGATDPDANSNISKITRFLEEGMGFGWSATAYSGVADPLVPAALERTKGLGFKRVIVFPYFLFTGRLIKRIYKACDEFAAANPDIQLVNAPYLNAHEKVIDTFVERLDQITSGDANMNCQLCQYREQIIGVEHRVGQPQEGHHHHVQGIGTDADHHHHDHDHDHHHHHGEQHGHHHHKD
ncbi:MAG TPA: sirohydrochlorin chelatase [Oceanospirillaceae bacterium]|nr:sirohydrochlorin chelatase [Oceanospirillaceae bacterium]